ncbi:helix-hairpin-helix domain-containing protein [Fructobacillus sp. M158]|uniref:helix-hairpin-helix domain-containing protein n=1 Tax=Fructobacillus parabroussonetiae TaxID=2713174 RepID=UPI00200A6819|nr:helix-hairpin-helix domain-containing protein [Fructobacillus parabroussonetiae]MCK8616810.1 helix-hairpin-helix domain-containing protein [Fructobacillus parabroussonetiae]
MLNRFNWEQSWALAKKYWWTLGLLFLLLFFLLSTFIHSTSKESATPTTVTAGGKTTQPVKSEGHSSPVKAPITLKVDLKGAVKKPGLYTLPVGSRLADLLDKAGGLTKEANVSELNLAQNLEDGMAIYIAKEGEAPPAIRNVGTVPGSASSKDKTTGSDSGRVRLNSASQKELEGLSGVGPKKAEQIIAYREEHPFQSVDELKDISGIGPKRFEQLKDAVSL